MKAKQQRHPCFYDGLVLANMWGGIWRVHEPPRWRLDRRAVWHLRRAAARLLALLRLRIPPWAQTAVLVLTTDWGEVPVRVVRDAESVVTWCDGVNTVPPEGLQ